MIARMTRLSIAVDALATALLFIVIAQSAMLGVVLRLYVQARRAAERIPVPPAVASAGAPPVEKEVRERWEALDLSRMHEANREEVEKLLLKVRGTGVTSLTAAERAFLDRMSQALRLS
jgi:hypothetical protein